MQALVTEDEIYSILKINSMIQSLYLNAPKKNIGSLLDGIAIENDLMTSLRVNKYNRIYIERYIIEQIRDLPKAELLIGTSPNLNDYTYPYYRLLAHMLYKLNLYGNEFTSFDKVYVNQESKLLYKFLTAANKKFGKEAVNLSYKILVDSPRTEEEIVRNGFIPEEKTALIYSSKRYDYLINGVILRILYEIRYALSHSEIELKNSLDFYMKVSYLKICLMYIERKRRKEVFTETLNSIDKTLFKEAIPVLRSLMPEYLDDIDEFEDKNILHLSLVTKHKKDEG